MNTFLLCLNGALGVAVSSFLLMLSLAVFRHRHLVYLLLGCLSCTSLYISVEPLIHSYDVQMLAELYPRVMHNAILTTVLWHLYVYRKNVFSEVTQ